MEDLSVPHSSPLSQTTTTPSPATTEAKPAKKRKSWGQVLPEPKTNLPPRKRAKTEDEKEQRRIERVKRNRLAAHNSRERKRQEVELLQAEKDKLEQDLRTAREQMARMAAELKAFRQRHPDEASQQGFDTPITTTVEDYEFLSSDTICPRQTSFPSPVSMDSMDTPRDDSCQPETPAYSETAATEIDQTRYPAAILCDLQCHLDAKPTGLPSGFDLFHPVQPVIDEEKPMDSLFDFDSFPSGVVDQPDFFTSFDPISNPYGLSEPIGAKFFDLQADSGATALVSDETCLAAEV
ncbi:hypothetical protein K469DRAFT_558263 [Zopfia rhizophila CBS 207.26]|uniref:BZIP domain-containing protein n=1 Tax=Zopfia rhizophila CBS 207.26 TaxID=1314779 RepID=A0A6A6EIY9_9PEZI|nr:hypothetical protein K469DRAFT_558263 [Zopfia rhizophila CBS 207.26]